MLGKTWRVLRACVTAVLAVLLLAAPVRMVVVNLDRDDDGLSDCRERSGLRTAGGAATYVTDPEQVDTDGDQVRDEDEIGAWTRPANARDVVDLLFRCDRQTYAAVSNPSRSDSDYDGLSDAVELSDGSDVFARDSDGDGLLDGAERAWGSDPNANDTDGDGFLDVNDVIGGLSPVVADEVEDEGFWYDEYAEGLKYGDIRSIDSVPQLLGSLSGSASSAIPVIGWVPGTAADLRDVVANSLQGNWTSAGMSGAGLVPYVGDVARSTSRVAQFVAENPKLAQKLVTALATWEKVPDSVRERLMRVADKETYDKLREQRLSAAAVSRLAARDVSLALLADTLHRAGTVVLEDLDASGDDRVFTLEEARAALRAQSDEVTPGPIYVHHTTGGAFTGGRLAEACEDCGAGATPNRSTLHFARVGSQVWSDTLQAQVDKDTALKGQGFDVRWHFFAGATGVDIDPLLVDALVDADIHYVVHMPG